MSNLPNRIIRISKAYIDQVKSRIDAELTDRERDLAEHELNASPGDAAPASASPAGGADDNSPEALMRRAEERIAAARRAAESRAELDRLMDAAAARAANGGAAGGPDVMPRISPERGDDAVVPARPVTAPATEAEVDPNASDYRVLGVAVGSDLATVQAAYEQLSRRCDPNRFPENSSYRKDAEKILSRVNAAYDALRRRLDPTENRFGKLELE